MKKFAIYQPLFYSFFSKALYRDVARNWRGIAALYLLLLVAVSLIPMMWMMRSQFNFFVTEKAPGLIRQIPEMTISNGELSIDKTMPYVIHDPDTDKPIIIIDTTGETQSILDTQAVILITKTKIISRSGKAGEIRERSLSQFPDMTVSKERVHQFILGTGYWALYFLYPFMVIFFFLVRLFLALIYGMIGMVFNKILGSGLTYQQVLRIVMIAITPSILIALLFRGFGVFLPYSYLFYFLVTLSYLYFGISANKSAAISEEAA